MGRSCLLPKWPAIVYSGRFPGPEMSFPCSGRTQDSSVLIKHIVGELWVNRVYLTFTKTLPFHLSNVSPELCLRVIFRLIRSLLSNHSSKDF